ncbi:ABC transporter ATP-binding protein [Microbacterium soli]|uniref:ABC transporter ATP-binding protein n=1 Tax=Microbacterium soli TaxID=446075 RepID=A0ABP7MV36_9MICO
MSQTITRDECSSVHAVEIASLHKRFGDQVALQSLDLTVNTGEFLVLLGPSGCGKTTTMRSIAGLEEPTDGTIKIDGEVVYAGHGRVNVPPAARRVGMVFQSYAIWPHRTVAQNIGFPLKMQKVPRKEARERVEQALELVGLDGLGGRSASMLSGGQMQRVALARSFVMQPRVLLLDEPLSNLDAKLRERLRLELKETQQRLGTTSIYVTHDQGEALALADRIVLMRKGVIEQVSTPLDLYQSPSTQFAAEFIGTNNLFTGTVTRTVEGTAQVDIPGLPEPLFSGYHGPMGAVAVSVRAEDVIVDPPETWSGTTLQGELSVVSLLGSQISYVVRLGDAQLQVLLPFTGELRRRGDRCRIGIPSHAVRCFTTGGPA